MDYLISFLEGIITFISPCLLPMLPIYVSYFAGGNAAQGNSASKTLKNAAGFVVGFTLLFVSLGAFAGTVGGFLRRYQTYVNLTAGLIVILFGLNFTGIFKIGILNRIHPANAKIKTDRLGFFSSILFGMIFAVSWTPCVGAFLGSALMLAASGGESLKGIGMLLFFSAGLGIPFIMSALLIGRLKSTFDFIKRHYRIINLICGIFLIGIGILMATGLMGYFLGLLSF